jgi:hypothetical protein
MQIFVLCGKLIYPTTSNLWQATVYFSAYIPSILSIYATTLLFIKSNSMLSAIIY